MPSAVVADSRAAPDLESPEAGRPQRLPTRVFATLTSCSTSSAWSRCKSGPKLRPPGPDASTVLSRERHHAASAATPASSSTSAPGTSGLDAQRGSEHRQLRHRRWHARWVFRRFRALVVLRADLGLGRLVYSVCPTDAAVRDADRRRRRRSLRMTEHPPFAVSGH